MTQEDRKFVEEHPEADFIAVCQVGMRGVRRYFTNQQKYNEYRDKAWESGHYMESGILKRHGK